MMTQGQSTSGTHHRKPPMAKPPKENKRPQTTSQEVQTEADSEFALENSEIETLRTNLS